MGEVAISLRGVSKCFHRYESPVARLREVIFPGTSGAEQFWALQDINLEVAKGETLGIIGQNGSGKSTLLQIIAGTLTPTAGDVQINGRVSALLELGSGFNPEFTGRQNVFFNGRILGLKQSELERKFDEIAAFADIGSFIDQPVKTYSSGMFVRLAFAVAVSSDPNILIVDEALSVGDIYFQQKCYERLKKLRDSGITLLFVSHDAAAVYRLCDRAVLLESGKAVLDSKPRQVIDLYEAKLFDKIVEEPDSIEINLISEPSANAVDESTDPSNSNNNEVDDIAINTPDVSVQFVRFLDATNETVNLIVSRQFIKLSIGVLFHQAFNDPHIGFKIRDRVGLDIFLTNTYLMHQQIGRVEENSLVEACFEFYVHLNEGEYTISVGVANQGYGQGFFKQVLAYLHNTALMRVVKDKNEPLWSGIINLAPSVSLNKHSAHTQVSVN
ncbi:ABC transporter ATP-binding protein [Leptolyngbya sp. FACHB-36]|uniref:ABC transporter ATP-binding protein n=1 Tax=Leptolyngbya sp. FACHB-36 TaxID=2692808 RepID=UPI0016816A3D|nr:ABC transporter ATP-binding protein [Leptolyngbya sp. FACHB-36]MBD2022387.1 ABC transporter ATP-binding protein [Leptolyngbya sp. FACHB-36]